MWVLTIRKGTEESDCINTGPYLVVFLFFDCLFTSWDSVVPEKG